VEAACDSITSFNEIKSDKTFNISPNPIRSVAIIEYSLDHNTHVMLNIFDFSGREIVTLLYEFQQQGEQRVVYNTTNLQAGIYFCVLKTNEGIQSKKMIKL